METDPETFKRAGLDKLDEAASARYLEGVFADGSPAKLITNRSPWRNFDHPLQKWTADNVVLIGDAKAPRTSRSARDQARD